MEIKWYAPAQWFGLVEDIAYQYNDGYTHYRVSAQTGDIFTALTISLLPILFLTGFLIRRKCNPIKGKKYLRIGVISLLVYAVLLATGIGPYIQFYPRSGGFLDFSTLEHIIDGIYCALLALTLNLGGKSGSKCSKLNS